MNPSSNLCLIGMPGVGKSTVGLLLAGELKLGFIDTDHLIEESCGMRLQQLVDSRGIKALRQLEERLIRALNPQATVIATGGSVVYSPGAMQHLREISLVVYLEGSYELIAQRIENLDSRGLVRQPGQSLADLYHERTPGYRRWAEITVSAEGDPAAVAAAVATGVRPLLRPPAGNAGRGP